MTLKFGNLSLDRLKLANIYSIYYGMNPREQTTALIAAAVVLVLVIVLPVYVASTRISRLERDVAEGNKQIKDVMLAIESYDKKKAELTGMQQQVAGGFDSSLSTTLESLAETNGIKDKIDSLKEKTQAPSDIFDEASVDVRLKRVTLEQLVNFLFAIEHHQDKTLRLKQLSIKTRFDNKQEMDASFTVSTFRLLEGAGESGT